MTDIEQDGGSASFASRLAHLIATVHPADRGPYSYREIAAGIRDHEGAMTATHVGQLATGRQPYPRLHYLQALAQFFGVPPAYFFDDEVAGQVDDELARVIQWRESASSDVLSQRISALSPEDRDVISTMVERLEHYESEPRARRTRRKPRRES